MGFDSTSTQPGRGWLRGCFASYIMSCKATKKKLITPTQAVHLARLNVELYGDGTRSLISDGGMLSDAGPAFRRLRSRGPTRGSDSASDPIRACFTGVSPEHMATWASTTRPLQLPRTVVPACVAAVAKLGVWLESGRTDDTDCPAAKQMSIHAEQGHD